MRHHILPLLKEKNRSLHTTIQRLSETLAIDQAYITEEAENMVQSVAQFDQEKRELSFEIDLFKTHAFALQRRAYHLILNYLYIDLPKDLSYVHEEQFFAARWQAAVRSSEEPPGRRPPLGDGACARRSITFSW